MKELAKTVGWVILIFLVLPIILDIMLRYSKEYLNKRKYQKSIDETNDLISEDEETTVFNQRPEFNYRAIRINSDELKLNSQVIIVTYDILSKEYHNTVFIKKFYQSVIRSMNEKRKFYSKKYRNLLQQLNAHNSEETFDLVKTRIESERHIIENILKKLKENAVTLTEQDIRSGMDFIFNNAKEGFLSVRGRVDFKDFLCRNLFSFAKNPLSFIGSAQNVLLLGGSGLGKTKLARLLGCVYSKTHVFLTDMFKETDSNGLVSEYVSSSGNITKKVVSSCIEGVCFIDEIYGLGASRSAGILGQANHGSESVNALVALLEPLDGKIAVVGAGYKEKVKNGFLSLNEGLERRFPHVFEIKSYTAQELTDILLDFLYSPSNNFKMSGSEVKFLYNIISFYYQSYPHAFEKQAGDMKNISEEIVRYSHSTITKSSSLAQSIIAAMKTHLERFSVNMTEAEIRSCMTH